MRPAQVAGRQVEILLGRAPVTIVAALRIDVDRLLWNGGRRLIHLVQSTHFNTGLRSFLEDLRHHPPVKTAAPACSATVAFLGASRSPGSES